MLNNVASAAAELGVDPDSGVLSDVTTQVRGVGLGGTSQRARTSVTTVDPLTGL